MDMKPEAESGDDGESTEAGNEPRSVAALACAIFGVLSIGLFMLTMSKDPIGNLSLSIGIGILSAGFCIVPLAHRRSGVGAKVLGVIGLIGWAVIGLLVFYWIVQIGRSMGWRPS